MTLQFASLGELSGQKLGCVPHRIRCTVTQKKTTKRKSHVSSDEEEVLSISEEEVEFLDQGVVQKPKKPSSRVRKVNAQTPCWKFFNIPQGNERATDCKKCGAAIICVDKLGKISTTGLNAHLRAKHGNQLDVGASELIRDIEKFENPTPRQQITSMLKKVSKKEVKVDKLHFCTVWRRCVPENKACTNSRRYTH